MTGIRTLECLRQRCHVCADTGCWMPRTGGRSHRNGTRQACVWLPALQRSVSIGIACAVLAHGEQPRKGRVFAVQCDTPDCANPEHRQVMQRGRHVRGNPCTPDRMASITKAARARSAISADVVDAIRAHAGTHTAAAAELGVSVSAVSRIRLGQRRAEMAPGASVFAWRGEA